MNVWTGVMRMNFTPVLFHTFQNTNQENLPTTLRLKSRWWMVLLVTRGAVGGLVIVLWAVSCKLHCQWRNLRASGITDSSGRRAARQHCLDVDFSCGWWSCVCANQAGCQSEVQGLRSNELDPFKGPALGLSVLDEWRNAAGLPVNQKSNWQLS